MRDLAHVTISVRDRRALARDEAERRRILRAISAAMSPLLLAFALTDDHLHAVLEVLASSLTPGQGQLDHLRVLASSLTAGQAQRVHLARPRLLPDRRSRRSGTARGPRGSSPPP